MNITLNDEDAKTLRDEISVGGTRFAGVGSAFR
jgi:hypothetical protein